MRKFVVRLLPLVHALFFGVMGSAVVLVSLVPLTPSQNPEYGSDPKNACEGGAICENWMELLRNYEPPPAVVRSPKGPKLKVRPSRGRQFL